MSAALIGGPDCGRIESSKVAIAESLPKVESAQHYWRETPASSVSITIRAPRISQLVGRSDFDFIDALIAAEDERVGVAAAAADIPNRVQCKKHVMRVAQGVSRAKISDLIVDIPRPYVGRGEFAVE